MHRRFNWDKQYLHWGVTAFCVIAASIVFYMVFSNLAMIIRALRHLSASSARFCGVWSSLICSPR